MHVSFAEAPPETDGALGDAGEPSRGGSTSSSDKPPAPATRSGWDMLRAPAALAAGALEDAEAQAPRQGAHLWRILRERKDEGTLEQREEEASESARKKMLSDPDGNLYRGWAVGIQKGSWQLFMTFLVIFLQVFGPFAMVWWAHETMSGGKFIQFHPSDNNVTQLFQKVLGMGFLALIFINGENILMRADMQTDMLRTLFPNAKPCWMFMDSFVNSWCVAFCALAAGPLLWTSEDGIKDVILDSFGLLFLHNIDEYSADVEYGIETSDFDDIIDEKQIELSERLLKQSNAKEDEEMRVRKSWMRGCFLYGDMWFSVGRVTNSIVACVTLPAYATLAWQDDDADDRAPFAFLGEWGRGQLIASGCLYALLLLSRAYNLCSDPDPAVTYDCLGIFIWMIVGRTDPRCLDKDMSTRVDRGENAEVGTEMSPSPSAAPSLGGN